MGWSLVVLASCFCPLVLALLRRLDREDNQQLDGAPLILNAIWSAQCDVGMLLRLER